LTSRQDRRKNKSNKPEKSGQINWSFWGGGIVVLAAIVVIVVIFMNSPESTEPQDESVLVSGGSYIGDPNAPVTLVEFGDFQ
jgi:protein-disulfide isomerase